METIKQSLETKGYVVIPNVITKEEVEIAKEMFYKWQNSVPDIERMHNKVDPHGIYKYHQAGHQEHAWYIRTRPSVQNIFKKLWNTDELVVSFVLVAYVVLAYVYYVVAAVVNVVYELHLVV